MHAVVSGGTKGIGLAIIRKLLAADAGIDRLTFCARNESEVRLVGAELRAEFAQAEILDLVCDVSSESSVEQAVARAHEVNGEVSLLVNNAGFGKFGLLHELTASTFREVLETNLLGVFHLTKSLLPDLRNNSGTVITISSLAGKQGFVGGSAYCAAKFGVRGLMQSLFLDARQDNVRVTTLFPGSVDTEFFASAGVADLKAPKALTAEEVAECVLAAYTLPGSATISELEIRPTRPK